MLNVFSEGVQVVGRLAIAADGAAAAELLDEDPLDALVSSSDGLTDAPLAANAPVGVAVVDRRAVSTALPRDVLARNRRRPPALAEERLVLEVCHEHMFASLSDGPEEVPPEGLEPSSSTLKRRALWTI
jgi:hypothetical protein